VQGHSVCRDILLPGTHHSGMVIKEGQRSLSLLQRWALAQVSTVTYIVLHLFEKSVQLKYHKMQ
jgi:hypothetical protein